MKSVSSIAGALALSLALGAALSAHAAGERECDVCPPGGASREPTKPVLVMASDYRECDVCPSVGELERDRVLLTRLSSDESR